MFGMPSCKQVTQMSSQLVDGKLTKAERFKLRVHLIMCHSCRAYVEKMQVTTKLLKTWVIKDRELPEQVAVELERNFVKEHQSLRQNQD